MKKLLLFAMLLGTVGAAHSQIVLEEAKISYSPASMKLDPVTNAVTINIPEDRVGEFSQDPLMFVMKKFDVAGLVDANKDEPYNSYEVWFVTKKGHLLANFDRDGDLKSSSQRFKDVSLPKETRDRIIEDHGIVQIMNTKYLANSKGWNLNKEFYRVRIKDANNKTKTLRLDAPKRRAGLAGL